MQLRMFVSEAAAAGAAPPLAMLRYTAGECNYGGKVGQGGVGRLHLPAAAINRETAVPMPVPGCTTGKQAGQVF